MKILVVDDEESVRDMLRINLLMEGHEVFEAANSRDAVLLAMTNEPERAIVDAMLPITDGFTICRALKELDPGMRVVIFSGMPYDEMISACTDCGADEYVEKTSVTQVFKALFPKEEG